MSKVTIGTTTVPTSFPGYPIIELDESGNWTHIERYWQATASVSIPAHQASVNQNGVTVIDPDSNALYLQRASRRQGDAPGVSIVELVYRAAALAPLEPSDNPKALNLSVKEIPIDDDRLKAANGGPLTDAQIATAKAKGYTSFPIYTLEYTYTDTDAAFAWTEANIVDSLQDTGTPTGISGATSANWQYKGMSVEETAGDTVIKEVWEYSGAGWVPLDS